jgi:hypothetical protein
MTNLQDISAPEDNSFAPETDLILSLLVIILLVGVLAWYKGKDVVQQKEQEIRRNQRTLVFQEKASNFLQGSSDISSDDCARLRSKVSDLKESLRTGKYQYLEIAGAASPEVGRNETTFDINIVKGYERAKAVAEILHSEGMPYECMKLSTYGRATSEYLIKQFNGKSTLNPKEFLHRFDSDLSIARSSERELSDERRTEIWGIPRQGTDSICMMLINQSAR